MHKVQWEPRISLGNLLGLLPLIVVAVLWAGERNADTSAIKRAESALVMQGAAQGTQATTLARHAERIGSLERQADRDRQEIKDALTRIENRLDRAGGRP